VVWVRKPKIVLVELAKGINADVVYVHREVSHEAKLKEMFEKAMKEENVEVK